MKRLTLLLLLLSSPVWAQSGPFGPPPGGGGIDIGDVGDSIKDTATIAWTTNAVSLQARVVAITTSLITGFDAAIRAFPVDTTTVTWDTSSVGIMKATVPAGVVTPAVHNQTAATVVGGQLDNGLLPSTINATTAVQVGGVNVVLPSTFVDTSSVTWTTSEAGVVQATAAAAPHNQGAETITSGQLDNGRLPSTINATTAVQVGGVDVVLPATFVDVSGEIAWTTSSVGVVRASLPDVRSDTDSLYAGTSAGLFPGVTTGAVNNVFIGPGAGKGSASTTLACDDNTAVGYNALDVVTSGKANVAVGLDALGAVTSASNNTAIGTGALRTNPDGANNTAVGYSAGSANVDASNCFFGVNCGVNSDTSGSSTAYGYNSLACGGGTADADQCVAVGVSALAGSTTADANTAVGYESLVLATTGGTNTALGHSSLSKVSTGTGNIAIGYFAGEDELGSDQFYVDNRNRASNAVQRAAALMWGTMDASAANQQITFNAKGTFSNDLASEGTIKAGENALSNYTYIDETGLWMVGNATQWEDVFVSGFSFKSAGASIPPFEAIGGTTTMFGNVLEGDKAITQEVFLSFEIPHGYKQGSDIIIHLHWAPATTGVGNAQIYSDFYWQEEGSAFPTVIENVTQCTGDGTAWKLFHSDIATISGTGKTIGSQIQMRISRKADQTADTADDVWLAGVGAHFELDSIGSKTSTAK